VDAFGGSSYPPVIERVLDIEENLLLWQRRCHNNMCERQQVPADFGNAPFARNMCSKYTYPVGCVQSKNDCFNWELDKIRRLYPAPDLITDCAATATRLANRLFPKNNTARNLMRHCFHSACLHDIFNAIGPGSADVILKAHECCAIHTVTHSWQEMQDDLARNSMGASCALKKRDSMGCCERKVRARLGL